MSEGAPDFYHKNNVYIKRSDVNIPVSIEESKVTIDANITNSELNVNISAQEAPVQITGDVNVTGGSIDAKITNTPIDVNVQGGNINANITNSEIGVNIKGSETTLNIQGDVNAKITNTPIDVNVQGGEINANITNAEINTVIKDSEINIPIIGSSEKMKEVRIGNTNAPTGYESLTTIERVKAFFNVPMFVINYIHIRVKNEDSESHNVTVKLKYEPRGITIFEKTVSVSAGFEGTITIEAFVTWVWGSLFVHVSTDSTYMKVGYTETEPYDFTFVPSTEAFYQVDISSCVDLQGAKLEVITVPVTGEIRSLLFGFDGTNKNIVPLAVTSDGKLLAVLG